MGQSMSGPDARDVSGSTQTWTKSERQIGHVRTDCPFRSARWIVFVFVILCPREYIQTMGDHLGRPIKDTLTPPAVVSTR
jgi:hypothetical protein